MVLKLMIYTFILLGLGFFGLIIWGRFAHKKMITDTVAVYKKYGFVSAPDCPTELCPQGGLMPSFKSTSYRFTLHPGYHVFIVMSTGYTENPEHVHDDDRYLTVINTAIKWISIYFPPQIKLDDAWLQRWKAELNKKRADPERTLVDATRTQDGGLLLKWQVPQNNYATWIEAVIADTVSTLPPAAGR